MGAAPDPGLASEATLRALEFPSYLRMLAELAATDAGRSRVLAVAPAESVEELTRRRRRFDEAGALLAAGRLVPSFDEPLEPLVEELAAGRAEPDGTDLNRLAGLIRAVLAARKAVLESEPPSPALAELASGLADLRPLLRRIERTLDRRGRVRDDASEQLVKLGSAVRRERDRVYGELQRYVEAHRDELAEETVPMEEGRLVVLLKSGARARRDGLVHRASGTGRSIYFEPLQVVEGNNRLRRSQVGVDEERQRLLRELVAAVGAAADDLAGYLELLGELDLWQAAHDLAALCDGRWIEVGPRHRLRAVAARHPLLEPRLAGLRERALGQRGHAADVVPLDLELDPERRLLVITGPNAGGKTVAVKTVGLMVLAAQAGLPFPADRGSSSPFLEDLVATVGDEQDLLADRSTFSGRLQRLEEAWRAAGPDALVLLDELGSGTDPEEGGALSVALLEGLLSRRALGLITTHLTPLAAAALELEGAGCAAMQFDPESHRPTFELLPGSPAGSEALALARRLGLPREWLDRAEELLGPRHRDLRRLLAEVETVRRELGEQRRQAEEHRCELERRLAETERSREALEEERARFGRRARRELDDFRARVKRDLRGELERLRGEVEAGRRRGLVEAAAERLFEEAPEIEEPAPAEAEAPLVVGGTARHRGLRWEGRLERLEGDRAEVVVGGKRVRCKAGELEGVTPADTSVRAGARLETPEAPAVPPELNLIGQRVEEALESLESYLDRALLAAHPEVRVIHGHGTGRLRRAVRERLRGHPAIAGARPGRQEEGGDGVTVVEMGP